MAIPESVQERPRKLEKRAIVTKVGSNLQEGFAKKRSGGVVVVWWLWRKAI